MPIALDLDHRGFDELVASLAGLRDGAFARPHVIAIDGRSGAGKSTLAARLADATGATAIDGDDFFGGGVEVRRDPPSRRVADCIAWRAQRAVLAELRAGRSASYHAFDWDAFDGRAERVATTIAPASLLILEGVYSARPELTDLLDLRVLLQVPDDERRRRLEAREGPIGEWERAWHEAEVWYFAHQAPASSFDVVVRQAARA